MMDIVGSIIIGVSLVALWAAVTGISNWFYGKLESYRYERWKNKNLGFIKHILRRNRR